MKFYMYNMYKMYPTKTQEKRVIIDRKVFEEIDQVVNVLNQNSNPNLNIESTLNWYMRRGRGK